MSSTNSTAINQPVSPNPEAVDLIERVQGLAKVLRVTAADNKKLASLKGNEELIHRIDEVLLEIEEQADKIMAVSASAAVMRDLTTLQSTMMEVKDFFELVNHASMFSSKHKMKLRMQNIYQSLRSRCTQLMTAVSLELLTKKPDDDAKPKLGAELYLLGLNYYFGLAGKPRNFALAFEKFLEASELGDPEAMILLAK